MDRLVPIAQHISMNTLMMIGTASSAARRHTARLVPIRRRVSIAMGMETINAFGAAAPLPGQPARIVRPGFMNDKERMVTR